MICDIIGAIENAPTFYEGLTPFYAKEIIKRGFLIFDLKGFSNSSAQYLDNFRACFLDAFVVQWSPKRFK